MHHNKTKIMIDEATVNALLSPPSGPGANSVSAYTLILEKYEDLDEDEVPYYVEERTTQGGATVHVVYNTIDENIFITGVNPCLAPPDSAALTAKQAKSQAKGKKSSGKKAKRR